MAVDQFLKLDGINGEAQDKEKKDEIDILAWSWGMSQNGTTHMGSGSGAGKVNVQDITFTKYVDLASTVLMQKCTLGDHIKEGTLTVRKAGGSQLEYIVITMKDIIVSSVSTGGSGGEDRLTENVSLNFGEYKIVYTEQTPDGGKGKQPEFAYDIAKNAVV
ncbi:Hcp family type VI secretion system effector [Paraglaciecola arctica]|uniref:Type VI secretion system secreted protein Hcp n=1 Tax=Paraglaciecola arctica BSs20135 TaxID=493475 RepID=K6XM23_9ALTE|nr:type VI secretion system tube protein Hcp [Paraglaciecola arctica]GAC21709.1 type VI secretion system secreted protein Hcp [Paraglaciecola arctica BSs20135]|tara:strand:+ start:3211 stop:3693 length:483 start_codon:yes stop_codon:yes gene_type:complete